MPLPITNKEEIRNDLTEIIRRNADALFLRFLSYFVLSTFLMFYLLYIRINNPTPLTFSQKILYASAPLLAIILILIALFMHISSIQSYNHDIILATKAKALTNNKLKTILEYTEGEGLNFNCLNAYIKFQHYKFQLYYISGKDDAPDKITVHFNLEGNKSILHNEPSSRIYKPIIPVSDWINISDEKLISMLSDLSEWLKRNKVEHDY